MKISLSAGLEREIRVYVCVCGGGGGGGGNTRVPGSSLGTTVYLFHSVTYSFSKEYIQHA